jgi:hypothetical protein
MMTALFRVFFTNLLIAVVVLVPIWYLAAWTVTTMVGLPPLGVAREGLVTAQLFVLGPLILSCAVQQVIFLALVRYAPARNQRLIALATLPIISIAMGLISVPLVVQFALRFAPATIIALLCLGSCMRLPGNRLAPSHGQ